MLEIVTYNEYQTNKGLRVNLIYLNESGQQIAVSDVPRRLIWCSNPKEPHYLQKWFLK